MTINVQEEKRTRIKDKAKSVLHCLIKTSYTYTLQYRLDWDIHATDSNICSLSYLHPRDTVPRDPTYAISRKHGETDYTSVPHAFCSSLSLFDAIYQRVK